MDRKTTRILFTIDKNVNPEETIKAAVEISRKANLSLTYIHTDESYDLCNGDLHACKKDFKLKYYKDLEYEKVNGSLWKMLAKQGVEKDCNMFVVGAKTEKAGLFGGGMAAVMSSFQGVVLFLNENTQWLTPKNIVMPLDGQSETRQKFYRVSEWAGFTRAKVYVLGVSNPSDKEDKTYVHTFSVQGENYMLERKIQASREEVESKECVKTILDKAATLKPCWISAVSNTEGIFKTSSFQKVCEQADEPILIMPYQEISGSGGVGY